MNDFDAEYENWKDSNKANSTSSTEDEESSSEEYYDNLGSKPCYTYTETKGCVMGKNIKKIKGTTLERCQLACDKDRRCKGVEFFKASGASKTSKAYREGDCLLNSGIDLYNPPCDADFYQLYFWEKS